MGMRSWKGKKGFTSKNQFRSTKGIGILLLIRVIIRESNLSFSDCTTVTPKRGAWRDLKRRIFYCWDEVFFMIFFLLVFPFHFWLWGCLLTISFISTNWFTIWNWFMDFFYVVIVTRLNCSNNTLLLMSIFWFLGHILGYTNL